MDTRVRPELGDIRKAVGLYLQLAYSSRDIPTPVRQRVAALDAAGTSIWDSDLFEKAPAESGTRYSLRLGSASYPHMKLVIEAAPDGSGALFRVDTHDRHIRPAEGSKEHSDFIALQDRNAKLAAEIEAAWVAEGVLTFKEYLRRDLQQRTEAMAEPSDRDMAQNSGAPLRGEIA